MKPKSALRRWWDDLPDVSKFSILFIIAIWIPVILNFLFRWNSLLPGYGR